MLVLSREAGESIHVGDDIVVTILGFARGQVRVGISAPQHIAVDRSEIWQKKRLENQRPDSIDALMPD